MILIAVQQTALWHLQEKDPNQPRLQVSSYIRFSMSISLVISQSKKEVIPSSSNNEKISERLGVVTK